MSNDFLEKYSDFGRNCQSVARIKACDALARTEESLLARNRDFNGQFHLFPAQNGVFDLRDGTLHRHDPAYMFNWCSPVAYDPEAKAPLWLETLAGIFPGEPEKVEFLQRRTGYWLTGENTEHRAFVDYGNGRNGKSLVHTVLQSIMGDAFVEVPISTLLLNKRGEAGGGARPDLLIARHARLAKTSEAPLGAKLETDLVKRWSGGDEIVARTLFSGRYETFRPQAKLLIATNHVPEVDETEQALFDRLLILQYNRYFEEHERDRTLVSRLAAEREGILAWAVQGAVKWYQSGLQVPASVQRETDEHRATMSPVKAFIGECCDVSSTFTTPSAQLFDAFVRWAAETEIHTDFRPNTFSRVLNRHGFKPGKRGGVRVI